MATHAPFNERFIDLKTYPLHDRNNPLRQVVIEKARTQLREIGAAEIPNFVNELGVQTLVEESRKLENSAFWNHLVGNAYLDEPEESLPADHTRRLVEPTSLGAIGYDQYPTTSLLRQIFEWEVFMNFIGEILELPKIYRYADPMGALNLSVMKDGDYLRWHFDQSDFVTSLSVQNADEGGEFEFVPLIRNSKEENYEKVRDIIKGSREGVVTIANRPGTLLIFQGRYSLHRVTPIKGKTSRLMGLFGYADQPNVKSSDYLRRIRYGRTEPMHASV